MTLMRRPLPLNAPGRIAEILFVQPLGGFKLSISFTGREYGEHDFWPLIARGVGDARPLRDPAYFAQVRAGFLALVWPNGFRLDSTELRDLMLAAGELHCRRGPLRSFLDN
jgi:hypothetical protein